VLTAARTAEALGAQWSEVDLDAAIWTVPGERMKMAKEHRVPLSVPAVAILREQLAKRSSSMSGPHPYVFEGGRPRQPLSNMALMMLLRRMGIDATVHGLRSSFRDWAGDETQFPREVAEAALAHAVGDETERAYRRGDALAKRRELMTAWAEWLDCNETAKVVSIASRQKRQ
jgi:integrase